RSGPCGRGGSGQHARSDGWRVAHLREESLEPRPHPDRHDPVLPLDEEALVRLVVVLGYSAWRGASLHPVCEARVLAAAEFGSEEDDVLISGGPEADLMLEAWPGGPARVLCDNGARVTAETAVHV